MKMRPADILNIVVGSFFNLLDESLMQRWSNFHNTATKLTTVQHVFHLYSSNPPGPISIKTGSVTISRLLSVTFSLFFSVIKSL